MPLCIFVCSPSAKTPPNGSSKAPKIGSSKAPTNGSSKAPTNGSSKAPTNGSSKAPTPTGFDHARTCREVYGLANVFCRQFISASKQKIGRGSIPLPNFVCRDAHCVPPFSRSTTHGFLTVIALLGAIDQCPDHIIHGRGWRPRQPVTSKR
ncbi:MAG: hypothetical protein E7663_05160 [Ruminococcaceae bacterium]|nr:hypothetical protein [Oscillospiraceae bacterium]